MARRLFAKSHDWGMVPVRTGQHCLVAYRLFLGGYEALAVIIILLIIIGFWGYNLIKLIHRRLSVSYVLTNQRFIHESGVLRRITDRIEVIDIDDITFEQGVVERIVGVGTIKIASSDHTHPELLLFGIENVSQVSGLIDDTRRDSAAAGVCILKISETHYNAIIMNKQSRNDQPNSTAAGIIGKLPGQTVVVVIAGIAAAWFAAGSTGFWGHSLRHTLTCLALGHCNSCRMAVA